MWIRQRWSTLRCADDGRPASADSSKAHTHHLGRHVTELSPPQYTNPSSRPRGLLGSHLPHALPCAPNALCTDHGARDDSPMQQDDGYGDATWMRTAEGVNDTSLSSMTMKTVKCSPLRADSARLLVCACVCGGLSVCVRVWARLCLPHLLCMHCGTTLSRP
jgi:hypothetical protein